MIKLFSLHKALTMLPLRTEGCISSNLCSFTTGTRWDCILPSISPLMLEDAKEN
jgi:hypothetical protein